MSSVFTNSTSSVGQTVQLLEKVVLDSGLKNLVMIHTLVNRAQASKSALLASGSISPLQISDNICSELARYPFLVESRELCGLLCARDASGTALSPTGVHLCALLEALDEILTGSFCLPHLDPLDDTLDLSDDEDAGLAVKIVELVKSSQSLGTTLKIGSHNEPPGVIVARVLRGGTADRSGLLSPGDRIIKVNDTPVDGNDPMQMIGMICSNVGPIRLTLFPSEQSPNQSGALLSGASRSTSLSLNASMHTPTSPGSASNNSSAFKFAMSLAPESACRTLVGTPTATATATAASSLTAAPALTPQAQAQSAQASAPFFVRAQFSYSPADDKQLPCREAGLPFRAGDVLRVVDTSDQFWWQAQRIAAGNIGSNGGVAGVLVAPAPPHVLRTGLIPGVTLLERREAILRAHHNDLILGYERVERISPQNDRPLHLVIALIGADGVGRHELQLQLVSTDPNHFAPPQLTTVAPDDVPNHQVGLVSREEFERLVQAGAFLEYSREGFSEREPDESTKAHPASASDSSSARSLLAQCPPLRPPDPTSASGVPLEPAGVTFDAIDLVIASGRVPVLALRPQSIRTLRNARYCPLVVFVRPPRPAVMRETRVAAFSIIVSNAQYRQQLVELFLRSSSLTPTDGAPHSPSDQQLIEWLVSEQELESQRLEASVAWALDGVVLNDDLPVALEALSKLVYGAESEPHWLPLAWRTQQQQQQQPPPHPAAATATTSAAPSRPVPRVTPC